MATNGYHHNGVSGLNGPNGTKGSNGVNGANGTNGTSRNNSTKVTNGTPEEKTLNRAADVDDLIDAVKTLIIPYINAADKAAPAKSTGDASIDDAKSRSVLVNPQTPRALVKKLAFSLPDEGRGKEGWLQTIESILENSVNTWDQGFMDKLYASTNAVGVVSELLLSVLNTNSHVYHVSPALTIIEKHTAKTFANLFGFTGPHAGGVTTQGGSLSNLTSIVIARSALYPETKTDGNAHHRFVLFTSSHGHYSVEKAALALGLGTSSVLTVPVDASGRMRVSALRELVARARAEGRTPLYVNATAGTTVMGSYDPFEDISAVCRENRMWFHIDGSWGGPAIFSARHRHKMAGSHLADSLTVNPHKMMNVPVSCSFLLGPDMRVFHAANTLRAGYLFHAGGGEDEEEVWDLADLTLQCGRRADSLKLALSWIYYGTTGFERQIDGAFDTAAYLAGLLSAREEFVLVSENLPPCLQVCFYYAGPGGILPEDVEDNTRRTSAMVKRLVPRGFMVDYAPGEKGSFFRVVVNVQTLRGTMDGLVKALLEVGKDVVEA